MADSNSNALLDIANNGAMLNQAISDLTTNVAKLSSITLPIANGGTGSTSAASARTSLGFGTLAVQNADNVNITGGTIAGISFNASGSTITNATITDATISGGTVSNLTSPLGVNSGGTGLSSLTAYQLLASGTTTTGSLQNIASGSSGQVLTSAGSSSLPVFQTITQSQVSTAFNASGTAPFYACRAWVNFNGSPLTGTYSRTGTTVTVTITAHGMSSGMIANLDFTSGTATDGNYIVTVTGANTFTVTDTASGSTSGNVTLNLYIKASGNVASVTKNGTGDYTVNFTTALSDANYAVIGMGQYDTTSASANNTGVSISRTANAQQAGSIRINTQATNGGTLINFLSVSVVIFR